jgi:hypothetical protein
MKRMRKEPSLNRSRISLNERKEVRSTCTYALYGNSNEAKMRYAVLNNDYKYRKKNILIISLNLILIVAKD